jgi:hypothetical protein
LGFGPAQQGDILGPWLFNELWAVISCLDRVVYQPSSFGPGERHTAYGWGVTEEDARADAAADWADGPSVETYSGGTSLGTIPGEKVSFTVGPALAPLPPWESTFFRIRGALSAAFGSEGGYSGEYTHALPGGRAIHIPWNPYTFFDFGTGLEHGKIAYADILADWTSVSPLTLTSTPRISSSGGPPAEATLPASLPLEVFFELTFNFPPP